MNEIRQIEDSVYRELQIKSLSSITEISENSIYEKLNGILNAKNKYKKKASIEEKSDLKSSINLLQEELIKLCFVKDLNVRSLIFDHLDKKWITTDKIQELYDVIYIHLKSDHAPNPSIILNEIKDSEERNFLSGLLFDLEDIQSSVSMAIECLSRLEEHYLKNKRNILREELKSETMDDINHIIKKISDIESDLKKIYSKYNDINKA